MAKSPMNMMAETKEEEKEASTAGARGKEYRDKEREGDEGQPYKRGGFLPEETEASEHERRGHKRGAEKEGKIAKGEAEEKYADEKKRGGAMKKRARGGHLDAAKEHKHELPKHQHHHARKHGGKVHGEEAKHRPDRRARGGATSELHPETAAGRMSVPDYERQHELPHVQAKGGDKSPYHGGHHRRPG